MVKNKLYTHTVETKLVRIDVHIFQPHLVTYTLAPNKTAAYPLEKVSTGH